MPIATVASITIDWDEYGTVSHRLDSFIPANDYQRDDALALSVTLVVAGQLGVLAPEYSLDLCSRVLDFLDGRPHTPELIQYPLSGARIHLHQKDDTIVPTFEPSFLQGGTMEPEEAVRRLLTAYMYQVSSQLGSEILHYMKTVLLATVQFYLTVPLAADMAGPLFSPKRTSPDLNLTMIGFVHTIYPQWKGGPYMAPDLFGSHLSDTRNQLKDILGKIAPAPHTSAPGSSNPASFIASPTLCEFCGAPAPTRYVELHENVGAMVTRFHRSVKGNLCKACIQAFFWNFTGKTITLGWWGVISFFITPFILLNNTARVLPSIGMQGPAIRRGPSPSPLWVLTTIGAFLFMAWVMVSLFSAGPPASVRQTTGSHQTPPTGQILVTPLPRPTNTVRQVPSYHGIPCVRWDEVPASSLDSSICVYGIIYTYGPYSNQWDTIYFSESPSAFRVMDFNVFYATPLSPGDCAIVYGRIRDYGPYLVITPDTTRSDSVTTSSSPCR